MDRKTRENHKFSKIFFDFFILFFDWAEPGLIILVWAGADPAQEQWLSTVHMNSGDGEQKKKKEEERGRGKQTGWLLLAVLLVAMAAVPPLFICISSSPCLCSPASLFLLLFMSMMVLWWPRMVALRWLFFFSPLFLPVSSSSLFCSVSLLSSFSLSAYVFFSFFRSLKEFSPFPTHLSPLVFTRRKKGREGYYPCPVVEQG